LLELLLAISIMVMIAGAMGALSEAVYTGSQFSEGHGLATQHARVALEEMSRAVSTATANEKFPGFIVLRDQLPGNWEFPATLVVWAAAESPYDSVTSQPVLPRLKDLRIYSTDRDRPNRLLQIRIPPEEPNDQRLSANPAEWVSQITAIRESRTARRVILTDLLHTAPVPGNAGVRRGMVWFAERYRPSEEQWADTATAWEGLPWVQGVVASETGLRQAWLRIELQLMPGTVVAANDPDGLQMIPFFGSAVLYYTMHREFRP